MLDHQGFYYLFVCLLVLPFQLKICVVFDTFTKQIWAAFIQDILYTAFNYNCYLPVFFKIVSAEGDSNVQRDTY